jgi:prepilin-type processing-associated H-X9-DG protein
MPSAWGLSDTPDWYQFSSRHGRVINFGFADGSVRPIMKSTNYAMFVYASGMQDGRVVDYVQLGQ